MNLHIIPEEKFTYNYIEFMNHFYPLNKNKFYIYNYGVNFSTPEYENVIKVPSLSKMVDLSLLIDKRDKLFIHGFYASEVIKYLCKEQKNIDFQRVVLIIWGADLYGGREKLETPGLHIVTLINEMRKKSFIKKTRLFMTFACADFDLLCRIYKTTGRQFDCLYPSSISLAYLDQLGKKHLGKTINIMLGNSATPSNQHLEALNWLKKYKSNPIKIFCPLSYGDKFYAMKVDEYGKKFFGKQFVAIKKYLKPEEYSDFLNSMDIAIFNNNRQQATANIEILSYLGKKIFIRSDTTTWKHYVERDKCAFYDTLQIQTMDFNTLHLFSEAEAKLNKKYFSKIWDLTYIKKIWDKILEYENNNTN